MSNERRCIKCGEAMRKSLMGQVEIDRCPGCGGIWLDRGEIRQLAGSAEGAATTAVDDGPGQPRRSSVPPARRSTSPVEEPCPACGGKLSQAAFDTVVIEHCIACEGIFLDAGELEKASEAIDERGSTVATIVSLAGSVATQGTIGE